MIPFSPFPVPSPLPRWRSEVAGARPGPRGLGEELEGVREGIRRIIQVQQQTNVFLSGLKK